ncbi:MAG: alpha/beta hydrolase [Clostridiales bacterium]|nr:alpha/beta hydrolase [Clostridiales bacterium]MCF8023589.1 alpha/beta hydrolase [Clostridiales bacterium]
MSETIVMIHGMMCGAWCWDNFKNFFESKGYNCIAPNLRYHDVAPGDNPESRLGKTGLQDYVEDIENIIRELDAPPVIMGHSMGGLIAQILGSRGRAKKLVLLTPAAPAGIWSMQPSVIKSFSGMMMQWGFWKKPIKPTFDKAVYSVLHLLPGEEQKAVYNKFVYESGYAAFQIGFWFLDPGKATYINEKNVSCPVLVISGREDRIVPASVVKKVAGKYNAVSIYKEFANHAHWVLGEPGWEEITGYIYQWNISRTV